MPQANQNKELLPFASPNVAAEVVRWLTHIGDERRMSPKTLEAYQRDAAILSFLRSITAVRRHSPNLRNLRLRMCARSWLRGGPRASAGVR
jgi:site-specific recombinase XerC